MKLNKNVSLFSFTSENGDVLQLNLVQAAQLACWIGARMIEPTAENWRFCGETAKLYRTQNAHESGLYGTFSGFTIDCNVALGEVVLWAGNGKESIGLKGLRTLYDSLIAFIAREEKGLKFPHWNKLVHWEIAKVDYTGYGFDYRSRTDRGQLTEFKEGVNLLTKVLSHYAYIGNQSIPRPDYIDVLCFGTTVYDANEARFILSDNTHASES